jgi:peptidyl-Lys metalloendopeptidase
MMNSCCRWIAACVLAGTAFSAAAAPRDALDVRLSAPQPVLRGDIDVVVNVTVTNTARHPVQVLRWQLPSDDIEAALFRITRDGQRVPYTGPLVKRAAPQASDHVKLDAGETLSFDVELTAAYDLSQNGRYAIEYVGLRGHAPAAAAANAMGAAAMRAQAQPLYLWLEARSGKSTAATAQAAKPVQPAAASISYASCSASQQTALQQAVAAATTYANESTSYLSRNPSATQRYVKWFGALSTAGWNTAGGHFSNVAGALSTQALAFDCKCKKRTTYAYVFPNQPYTIYLCGAFWSAPMTGTDSKAGTLIHEMTHFTVVAGTDDYAYGQTAAANLALTSPEQALDNADNHEYFAENTPALP